MNHALEGKKVAILVTDGFEEVEMTEPRRALEEAGAKTELVSPAGTHVRSWSHKEWSEDYPVDRALDAADAEDYDALVLPGGVMNPDKLRIDDDARDFVRAFADAGKPIAAICHGPWTLIDAGCVDGRRMTSYPSLRVDLENAGATWVDAEVVVDRGLVTSRDPDDLPAFKKKMIEEIAEGKHAPAMASSSPKGKETPPRARGI